MRDFESLSLHHSTREGFLNKIATYRHLIDEGYELLGYVIYNGYFVDARAADEA